MDLPGTTLEEAYAWVSDLLGPQAPTLERPEYAIPASPLEGGEPFPTAAAEVREILAWYAHGHHHLTRYRQAAPGAGPILCWPHHFDLAVLTEPWGPDDSRTVGVGLSPGDEMLPEPYWYVTPWPYPSPEELPALSAGRWVTEGWVGALLPGSEVLGSGTRDGGNERAEIDRRVEVFIREAVGAARDALTP